MSSATAGAPPSPYAAPNSPIASAKRARVTATAGDRGMHSPKGDAKNTSARALTELHEEGDDDIEYPIFSPALHLDGKHPEDHRHHADHHAHPHHLKIEYDDAEVDQEEDLPEEEEEEFNPFLFIHTLPLHASVCIKGKICLPPKQIPDRLTLTLDLDETLVHCTVDPVPNPDHIFNVVFNENSYQVYVKKRPYLDYFLESVSKQFEVVVFTASQQVYADKLLDLIDVEGTLVHHRLFRESCLLVQGNYLKDLTVLGRDLSSTVLVDNSPHAYGYQVDNGIPIESWFDDDTDTELLKLSGFLRKLQNVPDVRPVVRDHFKTYKLIEKAGQLRRKSGGGYV